VNCYYREEIIDAINMYEPLKTLNDVLNSLAKLGLFGGSYFNYEYDDEHIEHGCRCGRCYITHEHFRLHAWDTDDEDYEIEYSNLYS
jgi:hypothetical protein